MFLNPNKKIIKKYSNSYPMDKFNTLYQHILLNIYLIEEKKQNLYHDGYAVFNNTNDVNIKDEILTKLILLYPQDIELYYDMACMYKKLNPFKAISWLKIGFQINPNHIKNTTELCRLLLENNMAEHVFGLNKDNLFDKFMENEHFLITYYRCNCQKLRYKNAIKYILKLIDLFSKKNCITYEDKYNKWNIYHDIGYIYCSMGEIDKAIEYTTKASIMAIEFNLSLDDKLLSYSNVLCYSDYSYSNHEEIYKKSLQINDYYKNENKFHFNSLHKNKKIKIGYLSSDYDYHPIANFLIPILKNHDYNKFEIILFVNRHSLESLFTDLKIPFYIINNMTDYEAAKFINEQSIDILFDLNGHTYPNRLGIFALNPAPIQISYMGFPNTTGLKSIQYRIVDKITDPSESLQRYSEKLLYMPKCFLLYQSFSQQNPTIPKKTDKNNIILGAVNKENKNSKYVLETWKQILRECPNTQIMIKIETFDNNEERLEFYKNKLDTTSDRIIIVNKLSNNDYDKLFTRFDILLDTFPYSGTTTTCNALYNSVPIVTLYHPNYHCHNVSSSIMIQSGLIDLVAKTKDEYVNIVKQLVSNSEKIDEYKNTIHKKFMNLMEPIAFMKDYEELITNVYHQQNKKMVEFEEKVTIKKELQNNELLYLCVFDAGSLKLGINFLKHMRKLNITNYKAYVTDIECYNKLIRKGFNGAVLIQNLESVCSPSIFKKKKRFGSEEFSQMSFIRYKIISDELKNYNAVWYMDVDSVLLRDPYPFYEYYKNKTPKYDIIFQNDIHEIMLCTGCMLIFSSEKTINATNVIYNSMNNKMPDQPCMNFFIQQNLNYFKIDLFNKYDFPNGLLYFDKSDLVDLMYKFMNVKEEYENNKHNHASPTFVHANWMVGIDKKIDVLKRKNLWCV